MCTSLTLQTGHFYFGRNLDLEYSFNERVVITPRHFPFVFRKAGVLHSHYAMIGMASVIDGYPLYADAMNEKGVCIAGLNFPDNAYYPKKEEPFKNNISPFELAPWLLGRCSSVAEIREQIKEMHLIDIPFREDIPLSPLHWHIADRNDSIVLECTKDGMQVYENPVGVMTNNPPFGFQMLNLRQYLAISSGYPENCFSTALDLCPFGQGFGGIGLPGDFSPASRFVKAAFLKMNSSCESDEESSVAQFFHILDNVSMVRGSVYNQDKKCLTTTYSCCMDCDEGINYYKTYYNNQINAVCLRWVDLDQSCLLEYPLEKTQQIAWRN
ncbi:MAG: choloylglycine hydrolase family protein [Lachnospiraceae bacterium]|jgi:choloylglycine hydrolase|nr:choloylglycine hydrolase family protein [Lachnospiraceae bacterium]RKJ50084.1 linear amide C-N hydrolase [bacterium 1XD42-54]